jgi:hypothetical protein
MAYTFDAQPNDPTQKDIQYFAMLGSRGIWKDGWKAAAIHAPLSGVGNFDKDEWELYHVAVDRSESNDLAEENPEKLKELIDAWFVEAEKNNVLPLDDRGAAEILTIERPSQEPARDRYIYYPFAAAVPEGNAVNIRGRSYKMLTNVETTTKTSGILFAHGSRFGGHSLFIKNSKLYYVYNFLGISPEQVFESSITLTPGKHTVGMEFIREKTGENGESVGTTKLYIDEQLVAEGPMRTQPAKFTLSGDGLCVGYDSADAVSELYPSPSKFNNGTLDFVGITVEGTPYIDLEAEAKRVMMSQ